MNFIFDSTDKKILKHLIKDARIKVVDIASFLGVTSAAIHQRIGKIKRSGIIKEFTLRIDEKKLGYNTCAFVGVFLDKNSQYTEIIEKLKRIEEVVEAHYTTGEYGLFVKLYTKDNDHLMKVLNGKIKKIKEVTRTETFISLEEPITRNISF
jgi:Lrp/AsnC family transcriptional regulator for asnA, asnC and gidA